MTEGQSCQETLAIVLPSLNPDRKFKGVVDGLVENGFQNIVIVDDGSDDASGLIRRSNTPSVMCCTTGSTRVRAGR